MSREVSRYDESGRELTNEIAGVSNSPADQDLHPKAEKLGQDHQVENNLRWDLTFQGILKIDHKEGNQCNECGKWFTHAGNLKRHTLIHTVKKPYMCKVCGKCSNTAGDLLIHTRIHTGEKPYKCKVCGKCFSSASPLQRHKIIHTGEKP